MATVARQCSQQLSDPKWVQARYSLEKDQISMKNYRLGLTTQLATCNATYHSNSCFLCKVSLPPFICKDCIIIWVAVARVQWSSFICVRHCSHTFRLLLTISTVPALDHGLIYMELAATPLVAKLLYCARAAVVSCDMTSSISNFEGGTHKKKPLLSFWGSLKAIRGEAGKPSACEDDAG